MYSCLAHVENDSSSQCSGSSAPHAQSAGRPGRDVSFGLPAGGDAAPRRAAQYCGAQGTIASSRECQRPVFRGRSGAPGARFAVIVLDASAAIEWLLQSPTGIKIDRRIFSRSESLHAPHLLDIEVTQVLRRYVREKLITTQRGQEALEDLAGLPLDRYPHDFLLPRVWDLRATLTAYDAVYVALAELLDAPLLTCDRKIAFAPGHSANIEVI